jgi:hypothetical protein
VRGEFSPLPQGKRRIRVEKFFKGFLPIDVGRIEVGVEKLTKPLTLDLSRK